MEFIKDISTSHPLLIWMALTLTIVLSVIAFRIRFDINKWQEYRRKTQLDKLRAKCPHTIINDVDIDGNIYLESLFTKPSMSLIWVCSRCRTHVQDEYAVKRIFSYWANHPSELTKQEEKFLKIADKAGYL